MIRLFLSLMIGLIVSASAEKSVVIPTHAGKKVVSHHMVTGVSKSTTVTSQRCFAVFDAPIDKKLKTMLDEAGVKIAGSFGKIGSQFVYVIILPSESEGAVELLANQSSFWNIEPILPTDKIEETTKSMIDKQIKTGAVSDMLVFLTDGFDENVVAEIKMLSLEMDKYSEGYNCYRVSILPHNVERLAAIPYVAGVVEWGEKKELISEARELTKVNSLQGASLTKMYPPTTSWLNGVPNTGDSIYVCINERGPFQHLDFYEYDPATGDTVARVQNPAAPWGLSEHGTMVAGILAGNGWRSHEAHFITGDTLQWRGVAPKAIIVPEGDSGDVNNYSFLRGFSHAFYCMASMLYDERLSNHGAGSINNNVGVFATGNNGWQQKDDPQYGHYSILNNTKNGIKVGASEKRRSKIVALSSIGPTRDGRIGPDVVAPGCGAFNYTYEYEFDSIAIRNNGVRVCWNFETDGPTWGRTSDLYHIWDINHSNDTLRFKSTADCYLWSDNIFPNDTIVCSVNDTLVMRMKAKETYYGRAEKMVCRLFLKRPQDKYNYTFGGDDVYLSFVIPVDGNWHDVAIPLCDSLLTRQYKKTWADNEDTIHRLRLDFGWTHGGVVASFPHKDVDEYASETGTSLAAPLVSGIAALMLQKYREEVLVSRNITNSTSLNIHDNPFWNSTARAILVHTATDMVDTAGESGEPTYINPDYCHSSAICLPHVYTEGPDWVSGYGLVNAQKAVDYVDTNRFIEGVIDQGVTEVKKIHVTGSVDTLRVTLCWDDPANASISELDAYRCKLVNDLDLYLRHPETGRTVYPWVLDHNGMHADIIPADGIDSITPAMILAKKAFRGVDTINNLEVVDVVAPDTGIWEVYVVPVSITQDQSTDSGINQDYSLVSDIPFLSPPDTVDLVMGFEVSTFWGLTVGSGSLSNVATPIVQGDAAMQISGNGYQQIKSINIKTGHIDEKDNLLLDVYVGGIQPNPYWIGFVQFYCDCPSANIYNRYVGQIMLDGLSFNTFSTLTFSLPSDLMAVLAEEHDDFSFSFALNTNNGSGPYYLDNMRFSY